MSDTAQEPVLKIGIEGVAMPVPEAIALRDAAKAKQDRLREQIKTLKKKPKPNLNAIKSLERQINVVQVSVDRYQDPLDFQFPNYTPTPNQ